MPKITHIVDASSLIAYFNEEDGSDKFSELLADDENILAIHVINLCEVYYGYYRSDGQIKAEESWQKAHMILRLIEKIDESFMKRVGRIKATESLSLADAVAAASAEDDAVPLITTDSDFKQLARKGSVKIEWLREES